MKLNNKIRYLRKKNKFTQEELAVKLGVSNGFVSKWETGFTTPSVPRMVAMAKLFEVDMNYLSDDEV